MFGQQWWCLEMFRDVEVHRPLESAAALLVESPPPPPPPLLPSTSPPSYPHPHPPPISPNAPCPPRSFAGFLSHHHPQGSAQHRNFIQNNWDTIVNRSIYGMHNIIIISVTDSQCFSHIIWIQQTFADLQIKILKMLKIKKFYFGWQLGQQQKI